MIEMFKNRPWLWIVVAFLLLIGAWTTLISIAITHQPATIQTETP